MRIQLKLSANTETVPFNHLHQLTGVVHKWLGINEVHDKTSLYSFGSLRGGKAQSNGLDFAEGATWNISFFDETFYKKLLKGILENPSVAFGMVVMEAQEIAARPFEKQYVFYTDGGSVLARQKRADGTKEYLFWDSLAANEVLTHLLRKKLALAGFTGEHLNARVAFDRTYSKARTRKISIKGTEHKGSECPIIVEGTPEAIHFAWLVGVGDLTGSGFGALQ